MDIIINIPDEALKYFTKEELAKEAEEAIDTRLRQRKMRWQHADRLRRVLRSGHQPT